MTSTIRSTQGFTWIELIITITILVVLGAIAIPSYQNYNRKAYYMELVQAAEPYKIAVIECEKKFKTFTGCNAGSNGIPKPPSIYPKGAVSFIDVTNGIITITPVSAHGILISDTYVLIPSLDPTTGTVNWTTSGNGAQYTQ